MKLKVWVVNHNGNIWDREFENDQEATNFAKAKSLGTFCSIYRTGNNKMFIYENSEVVGQKRRREISEQVETIITEMMTRDIREGLSNRSKARKKG